MFATPSIVRMPNITRDSKIEADLHRVLPDAAIRAALVAMCPACSYTWWISSFRPHLFKPGFVPPTPIIDHPKKFAHAVLTGRQNQAHALDLALLALNGGWCAREGGNPSERWLELAGGELEKALKDNSWDGNRSYYHYVMGELCRLSGDFKKAVNQFNLVGPESMLPKELVERQKVLAVSGNDAPALIPPHLVEMLYCPWAKSSESQIA